MRERLNEINPAWTTAPYHAAFFMWYPERMFKLTRKRRRHQTRIYFKNVVKKMLPQYSKVTWHRSASAWQAKISAEGSSFYLGLFKEEIDAARAYDVKAKELGFFKEALNFP